MTKPRMSNGEKPRAARERRIEAANAAMNDPVRNAVGVMLTALETTNTELTYLIEMGLLAVRDRDTLLAVRQDVRAALRQARTAGIRRG